LELGPDAPGLTLQSFMGQVIAFPFSIEQIGENPLLRLPKRPPLEDFNQCKIIGNPFCKFFRQCPSSSQALFSGLPDYRRRP